MYQFLRYAALDHEVWLLTFSPSAAATSALESLRNICTVITVPSPTHAPLKRLRTLVTSSLPDMALRGRSAAFQAALDQLIAEVPFDVVQAESIEMAQYGMARRNNGPLYVYDAFNAEFLLQQRAFSTDLRIARKLPVALYSLIQWRKLRRYEARLGDRFHGALAVSPDDAAVLHSLAPSLPLGVVPNGVDTEYFRVSPPHSTNVAHQPIMLFTGTLDFRPNIDAVTWFTHEVLPLVRAEIPDSRFLVVGRNPVEAVRELAQHPSVEIVGEVADVRPWFERAAAYVVPMRIGGGVRLKVLEALAMEQPIVATHMGVEGVEGLISGTHVLLADSPAAFATQLCAVLRDPEAQRRLGEAGRALVTERYDWRVIVPQMYALWEQWRASTATPRAVSARPQP